MRESWKWRADIGKDMARARLRWLASARQRLWVFMQVRLRLVYRFSTSFSEGLSELKRVVSGDAAMSEAFSGSRDFFRRVRVSRGENPKTATLPGLFWKDGKRHFCCRQTLKSKLFWFPGADHSNQRNLKRISNQPKSEQQAQPLHTTPSTDSLARSVSPTTASTAIRSGYVHWQTIQPILLHSFLRNSALRYRCGSRC